MKRCTCCILPETFPGIRFDDEGVCQYCKRAPEPQKLAEQKDGLRAQFEELVQEVRPDPGYHCLVAWSGGKDSTYTLWLLKKRYQLRILAFTFDNGFASPAALDNVRLVAESLGVDHVIVKPRFDLLRRIFVAATQPGMYPPRALERASGVCNACMAVAKGIGLRMALEKNVPVLAYGWSPGQIPLASAFFRVNPRMLQAMVEAAKAPLEKAAGEPMDAYFPEEYHLENWAKNGAGALLVQISPLAFLEYDSKNTVDTLRTLGWERPQDTDPNSTNCLLNSFANQVHLEQTGYHPYVMELAGLVRNGYTNRQEALERLQVAAAPEVVAEVEAKLGFSPFQQRDGAK